MRSIAFEMGRLLGSRAHLSALRRLSIGSLSVRDAVSAKDLEALSPGAALAKLTPVQGAARA